MRKFFVLHLLLLIIPIYFLYAEVSNVSNVQIIPSSPELGQTVEIRWQYTEDDGYNSLQMLAAVSTQCTLRQAFAVGQWVVIGSNCINPPNPAYATVEGPGCQIGSNVSAGTHSSTETGTYTFKIPTDLIPGQTYYAIIGMRDYNIYLRNGDLQVASQACVPFTVPLPSPYIRLSKMVEGTTADPLGRVLYTIYYEAGNVTNFQITDVVNSNLNIVAVYNGGSAAGSTITWNLGNISAPRKGFVSFLAEVKSGVAANTIIPNTASATATGGVVATSNTVYLTVSGPGLSISKSVSTNYADIGSTITYSISYINTGTRLVEYQNFDSGSIPPTGWTFDPAGGTWRNTNGYLEQTAMISGYPALMNNTMTPIHDAIYYVDMRISSANTGHFDATFRFNNCNGTGYQARIHSNGCAGLTDPSQLILEVPSGTGVITLASVTNPHGLTILCDTWYTVKIKVSGTSIMMKVWPQGTDEYSGWDINITDSSVTCNGVVGFQANEGPTAWDNLKVFSIAGTTNSPRLFDTIPAGVSYINGSCSGGTSCGTSGGMITWSVGGTGTDAQTAVWRGIVNGACNTNITNTAGIDSNDAPPPAISNAVYVRILCPSTPTMTFTRSPTIAPTNTITRTSTSTSTRTPTPQSSPTFTNTRTLTFSPTLTPSPSSSSTPSRTATQTNTMTPSPSPSPTSSRTVTQTNTMTPSPSSSQTPSRTATQTNTMTQTMTYTQTTSPTPSWTDTRTRTPTWTMTDTVSSNTPTVTPTLTRTYTVTFTATWTNTRTLTPSWTNTVSHTSTFTQTITLTLTNTRTPTPTSTMTNTQTRTPTWTMTDTVSSNTPTVTPTLTLTSSASLTQSYTRTVTITMTQTFTNTHTQTSTPTNTLTQTLTLTMTDTISSNTPTITPTATGTYTITRTVTNTNTATATITTSFTNTQTSTATHTNTLTSTMTNTATLTMTDTISSNTPTVTRTWTNTWTQTPSYTNTATETRTITFTSTRTNTVTVTPTATETLKNTATDTQTITRSPTVTQSWTPTYTITKTETETVTQTNTNTYTGTPTDTATRTITPTMTDTPDIHSAELSITLISYGENAQVGAMIVYKIIIENKDREMSAYNIRVWDTLPAEVEFIDSNFVIKPVIEEGVIKWEMPYEMELKPGERMIIEFKVRMNKSDGKGFITNVACVDYQDGYYNDAFGNGRHPVITSNINEYPEEPIIAYPNPYKIEGGNKGIKFVNLAPNTTVQIYTISGENVISLNTLGGTRVVWDGKNKKGKEVASGIYYYVILNMNSKEIVKGKIFIIK